MRDFRSLQSEYPDIAQVVQGFRWVADGISAEESNLIYYFLNIAGIDASVARRLVDLPWIADGLTTLSPNTEQWAVLYLEQIAETDPSLANRLLSLPWVIDGVAHEGADPFTIPDRHLFPSMGNLVFFIIFSGNNDPKSIINTDLSLAHRIVDLPWFTDGLNDIEDQALDRFAQIAWADPSLAQRLLNLPWVADDITEHERLTLRYVSQIAKYDLEMANTIVDMPLFAGEFSLLHLGVAKALRSSPITRQLRDQPWFRDGLTEEEAARVSVLSKKRDSRQDLSNFNQIISGLIENGHTLRETVRLPSGIEVDLFLVSRSPIQPEANAIEALRIGVEAIPDFMELPWPYTDFVVLLEPEIILPTGAGEHNGPFVAMQVPEEDHARFRRTLYHELGHFLFSSGVGNDWFDEGAADFLETYTLNFEGKDSIESHHGQVRAYVAGRCTARGVENLQQLREATFTMSQAEYRDSFYLPCSYRMGELFLLEMYRALGHDTVSAALRELHVMETTRGWGAAGDEIYEVFLSNTPPTKQEEFRDLYRRLHGQYTGGHDRAVLVELYNSTDGANWINNENWLTDAPIHEWHGVTTDMNGRVSILELSGNNLTGPIPPELGSLTYLIHLFLYGNKLTGPIPSELGQLTRLQYLFLEGNQLTGPIPPQLGNLSQLRDLSLSSNGLSGPIPPELSRLDLLEELYLQSNQLTGEPPEWLADLPALDSLRLRIYLHDNRLTGCMPKGLQPLVDYYGQHGSYALAAFGLPVCK